jgi:hypothetical protein
MKGKKMGMSKHDAYYEPTDYDDRSDEIEERTWHLMKPGAEYDYRTTQAITEALGDLDTEKANALQAIIDTQDYEQIGRKIMMMALDYMERYAKNAAENEIND